MSFLFCPSHNRFSLSLIPIELQTKFPAEFGCSKVTPCKTCPFLPLVPFYLKERFNLYTPGLKLVKSTSSQGQKNSSGSLYRNITPATRVNQKNCASQGGELEPDSLFQILSNVLFWMCCPLPSDSIISRAGQNIHNKPVTAWKHDWFGFCFYLAHACVKISLFSSWQKLQRSIFTFWSHKDQVSMRKQPFCTDQSLGAAKWLRTTLWILCMWHFGVGLGESYSWLSYSFSCSTELGKLHGTLYLKLH